MQRTHALTTVYPFLIGALLPGLPLAHAQPTPFPSPNEPSRSIGRDEDERTPDTLVDEDNHPAEQTVPAEENNGASPRTKRASPEAARSKPPSESAADIRRSPPTIHVDEAADDDGAEGPLNLSVVHLDTRFPESADLGDALGTSPGLDIQRLGGPGSATFVSIRGTSLRHVEVMLDGIPLNPEGSGVVNLAELPAMAFDRILISKGNSPAESATAPIGGVVNLISPSGKEAVRAFRFTAGSFGTLRASTLFTDAGTQSGAGWSLFHFADLLSTANDFTYFDDNGTPYNQLDDHLRTRINADILQITSHLRMGWAKGHRRFTLLDALIRRDEGIPGADQTPTPDTRLASFRNLLTFQMETEHGRRESRIRLWQLARSERLDNRRGELTTSPLYEEDRRHTLGMEVGGGSLLGMRHHMEAWLVGRHDRHEAADLLAGEVSAPQERVSGILSLGYRTWTRRGSLEAGAVAQGHLLGSLTSPDAATGVRDPQPDGRALRVTPSLRGGLVWTFRPRWHLKLNAGRYYRPPDLDELFGNRGLYVGNPDLSPETGVQADLGIQGSLTPRRGWHASLEANLFWNEITDLIVYIRNAQGISAPDNIGAGRIQGLEINWTLGTPWLTTEEALTWNRSLNLTPETAYEGNVLPGVPAFSFLQRVVYHPRRWFVMGYILQIMSGNYWDLYNWYRTPPRLFHQGFIRLNLGGRKPGIELSAFNLSNKMAMVMPRNPLDPEDQTLIVRPIADIRGYPLPGRSLYLTLKWKW